MTKILSSDLKIANNSLSGRLEAVRNALTSVHKQIDRFKSDSQKTLVGPGYDSLRASLDAFSEAIEKSIKLLDTLNENIKTANDAMTHYIEGYDSLDTATLEELRTSYSRSRLLYSDYKESNKTPAELNNVNYDATLIDVERLIKVLEGLDFADQTAGASLLDISNDIVRHNSNISNLNFEGKPNVTSI